MIEESQVRLAKLAQLKERGMDPYPKETKRDAFCGDAVDFFGAWSAEGKTLTLAGRLLTIRVHGGMMFADLADESGKMQIAFKEDLIGVDTFAAFRDLMDPADFVEATGTLFQTKRGEKTLQVSAWRPLVKALLPLPEKWHGLQDVEARYRERELDLLSNPEVRERFRVRSKLVASMRQFLDARNFLEVETPVLQSVPGGANARPFVTHHQALDIDLYLRIAPELYLKRLLVGGFEKVYEVARCFRNEGMDYAHNPEFTQIELYWAYAGKEQFLSFMEEMVVTMIRDALGTLHVTHEEGDLDFTSPWPRVTFREAILESCGIDINTLEDADAVKEAAASKKLAIDFSGCVGVGECKDELFKKTARAAFKQPVWVLDYPVELKPLANRNPDDPTKSAVAQLVVHGAEIVNAFYYELNNPVDQRERLMSQQDLREQGSADAQFLDEDFLHALEHGMPPASGMGMGIDRLTALVTGCHSLKEVILFPTLRPRT